MASTIKKPDNRKYTLMIVPHQGKSTVFRLHLPMKFIKPITTAIGILLLAAIMLVANYGQKINIASSEKAELETLRQINVAQKNQIEELSGKTAVLQEDMNRLNQLESDIRKLITSEDDSQTSRSSNRPNMGFNGQGGPVSKPQLEQIASMLQNIQSDLKTKEETLTSLRDTLQERKVRQACTPSIWPANGDVTSRFGWRNAPLGSGSDFHPGIDIANNIGTPISAAADGRVVYSGWYSGYGKLVQIDHGNGIETLYGHCSELIVHEGQTIHKGELIAYMGSTGWSTGSHVHYEVRANGSAVNPASFLNN